DLQQRISKLRIPGKTSSNAFKNKELSLRDIASELKVEAVIEAELMRYGDSIEMRFRLINVYPDEKPRWINKYTEDKSKLLNIYSRLTKSIADDLKIELSAEEENLLAETRTIHPDAMEAYLKGKAYWEKLDPESMQKALYNFELATQIEPEWADPYAGLANAWGLFGMFEFLPKSETLPKKDKYLNKALHLNPNSAQVHYVKALNSVWTEWDWEQGEKDFLKTIQLNPNDALARLYYAHLLMILRRNTEAVEQANIGLELDPLKPLVISLYAVVMQNEGKYKTSLFYFNKALSIDPDYSFAKGNLLGSLYFEKEYEKWIKAWENKVRSNGRWNEEAITSVVNTFYENDHIAAIEEMFKMNEKYGNEGAFMSNGVKITRYLDIKNHEKALDLMDKISETKGLEPAYYGTNTYYYNELKDNPRYIALLKKLNLPIQSSD
ncbi:MAG: hypothetical protein R3182_08845, partial [Draconibacterium sp.]|nr:hypothetical protein [Draconibacterium sp.]